MSLLLSSLDKNFDCLCGSLDELFPVAVVQSFEQRPKQISEPGGRIFIECKAKPGKNFGIHASTAHFTSAHKRRLKIRRQPQVKPWLFGLRHARLMAETAAARNGVRFFENVPLSPLFTWGSLQSEIK